MSKVRIYDYKARVFDSDDFDEILKVQIFVHNLDDQGYDIAMINYRREPERFGEEPEVSALLKEKGEKGFPCMTVDGRIMLCGRYPSETLVRRYLGSGEAVYDTECSESACASCGRCGGHC